VITGCGSEVSASATWAAFRPTPIPELCQEGGSAMLRTVITVLVIIILVVVLLRLV
jgi:hypothetical protein